LFEDRTDGPETAADTVEVPLRGQREIGASAHALRLQGLRAVVVAEVSPEVDLLHARIEGSQDQTTFEAAPRLHGQGGKGGDRKHRSTEPEGEALGDGDRHTDPREGARPPPEGDAVDVRARGTGPAEQAVQHGQEQLALPAVARGGFRPDAAAVAQGYRAEAGGGVECEGEQRLRDSSSRPGHEHGSAGYGCQGGAVSEGRSGTAHIHPSRSRVYSRPMFRPLPVWIGLRYTRARRRNQFISFISFTSMLGVALGVAALITVLSVMNGFEKELRGRILGMTSHATLLQRGGPLADWRAARERLMAEPAVLGAAPFIQSQAMVTHAGAVTGVNVTGVLPEEEPAVSVVAERLVEGELAALEPGAWRVIIGTELARTLHVGVGDSVTVVAPQPTTTAVGVTPRLRRFEVAGIFEVGMHDYDAGLALVHLEDAGRLFRVRDGVTGLRLKLAEPMAAPWVARELARGLDPGLAVVDWTQFHANFFRALRSERVVMFVILTLIVAVAAFNIVSTLVMLVTDKQADIAILRTLGLSARAVMGVFIVQGLVVGMVGILAGVAGGVWLASNVQWIVQSIERAFSVEFLPADVYYISELPSSLEAGDVVAITLVSFVLCALATLYPAWKASRTKPAEALRYE